MWCRECHKEVDVKAAGSACPLCGRTLVVSSRQTDDIRRAYEILERWQSSDLFERISTTAPLTTLKQQDRAPLLNIPLGKKTVTVPSPDAAPATVSPKPARVEPQHAVEVPRNRVTLESLKPPTPTADQMIWELLVAPKPVLATAAPALEDSHNSTAVIPEPLAAGVRENRLATTRSHAIPDTNVDDFMSNAANSAETDFFSGFAHENVIPQTMRPASLPRNNSQPHSVADISEEIHPHDSSPEFHRTANSTQSPVTLPVGLQPTAVRSGPSASALGVEVIFPTAESPVSTEVVQSALPVPMSSASIHEESASLESKSAKAANDSKQHFVEATKKSQRSPMRRPPLHRRFQLDRPVPESSAGSDTVTRKLRLDQTGGNAENSQGKEPVTSLPSSVAPETKIVSNSPKPGRRFRIDTAESVDTITDTAGSRSRTHSRPKHRYIDDAHESTMRGPHFEVSTPRRTNLTSITGQFLAYLGVLGLTIGTAMVIYGHFGGYSEYTPTGWLVTTVAQMLLFLGVINLVSGGIEQNNEDVSRRINTIGEQLLRIELVTSEVARGPKIPARRYAEDGEEVEESSRETVAVDRR